MRGYGNNGGDQARRERGVGGGGSRGGGSGGVGGGEECSSIFSFSGMFGEAGSTNMPVLLSSDYISFSLSLLLSGSKNTQSLVKVGACE